MGEKRDTDGKGPLGYRAVGIVFMVAAVVFVFTGNTAIWVSMFTIGIVFLSLSATVGRTPADDATASDTEEPHERPEE